MISVPRTAYILQVHKNPNQVNKFIKQLIIGGQADVYVHIDKKKYEEMHGQILKNPHVKVLQQSIHCEWGNLSQIDTTILLLREVLASQIKYDYVCLRSGQDLLIKDGFKNFLLDNPNKIYITLTDVNKDYLALMKVNWPKVTRKKYTTPHPFRILRRVIHILYRKGINIFPNKKKWPKEYNFYHGSQWFTIPYEVAKFIINFLDKNEWYYKYFEKTYAPDEWFFHTLIMNSHYKTSVVNDNLFFLKWGEKFSNSNSPEYLMTSHLNEIEESNQFFARKFDINLDCKIVEYFSQNVTFRLENYTVPNR